jgi:opacity protein-like surface antigen
MKTLTITTVTAVLLAAMSAAFDVADVAAADTAFKPSISVSEEFTDNVFELPANKRWELITRARPGASYRYQSPLWTWDTAYTFEYRNYARNSKPSEYTHDAALKGNIAVVENFLFLDLGDTYKRVTLDVTRNAATESSLFLNQTDQNIATASPYLVWRLRKDDTLKSGYRYTDTRYWDTTSIDKQEHRGFADLTHELSSQLSISTGYNFTRLESHPSKYNKHDVNAGFRYEYAEKSFLFGQIGNSWQIFNSGTKVNYLLWNAGLTHDLRYMVATLETKVANTEDPLAVSTRETSYSGKLERTFDRGLLGAGVSYSEFANTETKHTDRRKFTVSTNGRYELMPDLTASLSASVEHFSKIFPDDFSYRFNGTAGLSYAFKNELTLALTYNYVTELHTLESSAGAKEINKVVVELKKAF